MKNINSPSLHFFILVFLCLFFPKTAFSQIEKGKRISFQILVEEHNLMPGSYPLYFWVGTMDHFHFDVLDDLLPPLQIVDYAPGVEKPSSLCQSKSRLNKVLFS